MGTSQDTYLIFPHSLIEPDSYFCSEEWGEFSEGPTARIYGSSYHGRLLAEPHDVNPYIWQIWMKWCVFLTLQRTGHLITLKRHFFVFSLHMVSPCVLPLILSRRSSVLCCCRNIRGRTTGLHMTEELNAASWLLQLYQLKAVVERKVQEVLEKVTHCRQYLHRRGTFTLSSIHQCICNNGRFFNTECWVIQMCGYSQGNSFLLIGVRELGD